MPARTPLLLQITPELAPLIEAATRSQYGPPAQRRSNIARAIAHARTVLDVLMTEGVRIEQQLKGDAA